MDYRRRMGYVRHLNNNNWASSCRLTQDLPGTDKPLTPPLQLSYKAFLQTIGTFPGNFRKMFFPVILPPAKTTLNNHIWRTDNHLILSTICAIFNTYKFMIISLYQKQPESRLNPPLNRTYLHFSLGVRTTFR